MREAPRRAQYACALIWANGCNRQTCARRACDLFQVFGRISCSAYRFKLLAMYGSSAAVIHIVWLAVLDGDSWIAPNSRRGWLRQPQPRTTDHVLVCGAWIPFPARRSSTLSASQRSNQSSTSIFCSRSKITRSMFLPNCSPLRTISARRT